MRLVLQNLVWALKLNAKTRNREEREKKKVKSNVSFKPRGPLCKIQSGTREKRDHRKCKCMTGRQESREFVVVVVVVNKKLF